MLFFPLSHPHWQPLSACVSVVVACVQYYLLHKIIFVLLFRKLELLREGREKRKVMVESIVKQRDMYRVLLAQSTLQPPDMPAQVSQP